MTSSNQPCIQPGSSSSLKKYSIWILLSLLALYIIWGSTYYVIRLGLTEGNLPPFQLGALRYVTAGIILYAILRLRGVPSPTLKEWGGASIVGILLLVGGNGSTIFAEQKVSSSLTALMIALIPIWATLFAGLWGKWPSKMQLIGVILGIAGVTLLSLEGIKQADGFSIGLLLFATASWAFGSVWGKHLTMPKGFMSSAAQMLVAGVIFVIISAIRREPIPSHINPKAFFAVAYLVVFGSLIAYSAYSYLLQTVSPVVATSYAFVNPVVAVFIGSLLAHEKLNWLGIIGMAIVLAAVLFVLLGDKSRTKTSSEKS